MTVEPGDLEVAGVLTNVGIVERTFGMGFTQRAVIQNVVKDHGNAQRADLNPLGHFVPQGETQDKLAFLERPGA